MILEAVTPRKESMQVVKGLQVAPAPPPVKEVPKAREEKKPVREEPVGDTYEAKEAPKEELLKGMLEVLKDHTSENISMRNIGFEYGFHEGTGRMTVTMVDKDTDEVIREIPSERLLDLVNKMEELVGVLFDAKA
ncbi:MAG: flagellar protein FlaG [Desulfatibacillum sp.]|nr:flagellar protein FlaG [Desulfatibacillum sp.]